MKSLRIYQNSHFCRRTRKQFFTPTENNIFAKLLTDDLLSRVLISQIFSIRFSQIRTGLFLNVRN